MIDESYATRSGSFFSPTVAPVHSFRNNASMAVRANAKSRGSVQLKNSMARKPLPEGSPWRGSGTPHVATVICIVALIYAWIAGLRTIADHDLGWQLATGRWIAQHDSIPSTDVLSFTAHGQPWIYPAVSQLLLYFSYAAGGYSLLSWLGAAVCVGTIAVLLRRGRTLTALLALIAVPLIAARTAPRAELFTVVLSAVFLSILWHYHHSGVGKLWLLPILMCLWTNLHLGFIAGLALCLAYLALELGEVAVPSLWPDALKRLRRAAPWLAATAAATLLNPWGPRIYVAIARQNDVLSTHTNWVREWSGLRIAPLKLLEIFNWREPNSAVWWLLIVGVSAAFLAACRRKFASALLLVASVYIVIRSSRMEALFACMVVIVGSSIVADSIALGWVRRLRDRFEFVAAPRAKAVPVLYLCVVILFVAVRANDLVTDRYYLKTPQQFSTFGPGPAFWYPTEAAAFLLREHLPGNIFNDYNSGGFVVWALSPSYPDYIDGRAIPFGNSLLLHSMELGNQTLDAPAWQSEADARNLNTVFVSTDYEMSPLNQLRADCTSQQWRPVYLDTHAAIFVRVKVETAALVARLQIDCSNVRFDHPPPVTGMRGRADAFRYSVNAAYILLTLGRPSEALDAAERAGRIFPESASLHFVRGFTLLNLGRWQEAEQDLQVASELGSDDAALALAAQYEQRGRYREEARVLSRAAQKSDRPYFLYMRLGYAQLALRDPQQALMSFARAEDESPFVGEAVTLGANFRTQLENGRRLAQKELGRN
jgi:tetratricopeptide (TPR) repeat protein